MDTVLELDMKPAISPKGHTGLLYPKSHRLGIRRQTKQGEGVFNLVGFDFSMFPVVIIFLSSLVLSVQSAGECRTKGGEICSENHRFNRYFGANPCFDRQGVSTCFVLGTYRVI